MSCRSNPTGVFIRFSLIVVLALVLVILLYIPFFLMPVSPARVDDPTGFDEDGSDYKLLPNAYINTQLIAEQGDEILRFVATIKLKEATASQLFKRLNSYARPWEFARKCYKMGCK